MNQQTLTGNDYVTLLNYGLSSLASDYERINELNVFPVPDGDTGSNMKMTLEGGVKCGLSSNDENLGSLSKAIARAMVLSARGNSGVILSQFFKGVSIGFEGLENASILQFADAMVQGTKKAYSVVSNPTEGTILTIMREAGAFAIGHINSSSTLTEYLSLFLDEAQKSLEKTPDLLPVLKKAGVIDSGGAGFILIIEGMLKASMGVEIGTTLKIEKKKEDKEQKSTFDADSILTYGYCTEFILQLQNSKVNIKEFDSNIIVDYLKTIGDSIVAFKDEDLFKVHVHTMDPGIVLSEMRKYGEFISVKIENMNVQHSENTEIVKPQEEKIKYALVAVANGEGLASTFKELGVNEVISGGQTMNTSTEDFINAFEKINAENILVFPNNSNIRLAAKIAADTYDKANVYVLPALTIAEGFSAISMLNFDSDNIELILEEEVQAIKNVNTLEVTYSIRDTSINDLDIKKQDNICIYNGELIASANDRKDAIYKALNSITDFKDKEVMTIFYGNGVDENEVEQIIEIAKSINNNIECFIINGKQDIYSYIISIE